MEKILQIRLNWSQSLYVVLLYGVAQSSNARQAHIWLGGDKQDKRSPWGGKMIGKLLLIVTVADTQ